MTSVNCRHLWLCATSRSSSDVEVKIEVVNARLVTVLFLYNDDLEKCIVEIRKLKALMVFQVEEDWKRLSKTLLGGCDLASYGNCTKGQKENF